MRRMLVTKQTRRTYERVSTRVGLHLAAAGIRAWVLTALTVAFAGVAGWLLAREEFLWALAAGGVSGALDMLDGATARASNTQSGFGTLLDRTADRTVEMLFLLGFLLSGHVPAWLVLATLFGLFLPSYVRAVAESAAAVPDCEVGLAGRLEKLLVLTLGTIGEVAVPEVRPLAWSMAIVTVLSIATAIQRLVHASRISPPSPPRDVP